MSLVILAHEIGFMEQLELFEMMAFEIEYSHPLYLSYRVQAMANAFLCLLGCLMLFTYHTYVLSNDLSIAFISLPNFQKCELSFFAENCVHRVVKQMIG